MTRAYLIFVFAICFCLCASLGAVRAEADPVAECVQEVKDLEEQLRQLDSEKEKALEQFQNCKSGSDALKTSVAASNDQVKALKDEKASLLSKIEDTSSASKEEIEVLTSKVNTLENALKKSGESAKVQQHLQDRVQHLTAELTELKSKLENERKSFDANIRELTNELNRGLTSIVLERAKLYYGKASQAAATLYADNLDETVQSLKAQSLEMKSKLERKFSFFYNKQFLPVAGPYMEKVSVFYAENIKEHLDLVALSQDLVAKLPEAEVLKQNFFDARSQSIAFLKTYEGSLAMLSPEDIVDWSIYTFGVLTIWFTWRPAMRLSFKLLLFAFYTSMFITLIAALAVAGMKAAEAVNKA